MTCYRVIYFSQPCSTSLIGYPNGKTWHGVIWINLEMQSVPGKGRELQLQGGGQIEM